MRRSALLLTAGLGLGACAHTKAKEAVDVTNFSCRGRAVSYVVNGHISGDELGVQLDCDQAAGPRLLRWKVDRAGTRLDDARGVSGGEFDKLWSEVEAIGWRYLKDCKAGGGKSDPRYTFDVRDESDKVTFTCQARAVPYPYDGIVNPLDRAAAEGRAELGDGDPAPEHAAKKKGAAR
jgi:hypothetical protein